MENVLNRGLNFCVTPENVNMTEVLADFRKFDRSMKWKEHFADIEETDQSEFKREIFHKEKSNLPQKSSKNLQNFLAGVKSELTGTQLNRAGHNIPRGEIEAIKTLVKMQRNCLM